VKYWEIIANRLSKDGCSLGGVSAVDSQGRTICIAKANAERDEVFVPWQTTYYSTRQLRSGVAP
jgi:hypothetical protein